MTTSTEDPCVFKKTFCFFRNKYFVQIMELNNKIFFSKCLTIFKTKILCSFSWILPRQARFNVCTPLPPPRKKKRASKANQCFQNNSFNIFYDPYSSAIRWVVIIMFKDTCQCKLVQYLAYTMHARGHDLSNSYRTWTWHVSSLCRTWTSHVSNPYRTRTWHVSSLTGLVTRSRTHSYCFSSPSPARCIFVWVVSD